jgi:hypothetical protein
MALPDSSLSERVLLGEVVGDQVGERRQVVGVEDLGDEGEDYGSWPGGLPCLAPFFVGGSRGFRRPVGWRTRAGQAGRVGEARAAMRSRLVAMFWCRSSARSSTRKTSLRNTWSPAGTGWVTS